MQYRLVEQDSKVQERTLTAARKRSMIWPLLCGARWASSRTTATSCGRRPSCFVWPPPLDRSRELRRPTCSASRSSCRRSRSGPSRTSSTSTRRSVRAAADFTRDQFVVLRMPPPLPEQPLGYNIRTTSGFISRNFFYSFTTFSLQRAIGFASSSRLRPCRTKSLYLSCYSLHCYSASRQTG